MPPREATHLRHQKTILEMKTVLQKLKIFRNPSNGNKSNMHDAARA